MKKYIFLLSVILAFIGCEKEMMDYEGKDGIYFCVQEVPPSQYGNPEIWAHIDTTLLPFSLLLVNDTTVRLKVRVMGPVTGYDRYFTLAVIDSMPPFRSKHCIILQRKRKRRFSESCSVR